MKETEFKALMHCGQYVDTNLLEKGIYACSKPFIYAKDETIETMIERGRMTKDMTGASFISEKYFDKAVSINTDFNYGGHTYKLDDGNEYKKEQIEFDKELSRDNRLDDLLV